LRRTDLDDDATAEVLRNMEDRLDRLLSQLSGHAYETVGTVPPEADVTSRVVAWLESRPRPIPIANRPNA